MRRKGLFQYKQFTIDQQHAAMKVGTDSDLLGTLSAGGNRILDIGTGTGVLSLMLAQRCSEARITAIEIDENAMIDARTNIDSSPFCDRIDLHHISFQDYLTTYPELIAHPIFDSVICNPPYFDKSLECDDLSRTRARHSSSLPFDVLIGGAYSLLKENGVFSVCIPPEVLDDFTSQCIIRGFWLQDIYKVKSVPEGEPKRLVLVHKKGATVTSEHVFCMRNEDRSRSDWYKELMKDFHL